MASPVVVVVVVVAAACALSKAAGKSQRGGVRSGRQWSWKETNDRARSRESDGSAEVMWCEGKAVEEKYSARAKVGEGERPRSGRRNFGRKKFGGQKSSWIAKVFQ